MVTGLYFGKMDCLSGYWLMVRQDGLCKWLLAYGPARWIKWLLAYGPARWPV